MDWGGLGELEWVEWIGVGWVDWSGLSGLGWVEWIGVG